MTGRATHGDNFHPDANRPTAMDRSTPPGRTAAVVAAAVVLLALALSRRAARGVPLSPLTAGRRVGAEFVERRGIGADELDGEMDDMDAFARPDFDPDAVHPTVRAFYEETAAFEMRYRARWHRGFRLGAAAAARLTARVGQLGLPGPGEERRWRRLDSRIVGLDPDDDPREGARAWVRTDPDTGEAVFVALYGHHRADGAAGSAAPDDDASDPGERYVNIAVPLPAANLSTVLRLEHLDDAPTDGGVRLTTRAPGDPGLYLATPGGAFALPMAQTFRVWPDPDDDSRLRATHEMWALGRQFLTVEYEIAERRSDGDRDADAAADG